MMVTEALKLLKVLNVLKHTNRESLLNFLVKPVRFVRSFFSSKLNTVLVIVRENKDQERSTGIVISGQPGLHLKNY